MSILPLLFGPSFTSQMRPSRIFDQHFGVPLDFDDLQWLSSVPYNDFGSLLRSHGYYRPWRSSNTDTGSTVNIETEKFQVNLDVKQFQPGEITVKVTGTNQISVEGKHEEKRDDHGFISRHFVRKYVIPEGYDMEKVVSQLSSDGVLSIIAPKMNAPICFEGRDIPISQTGAVKDNKEMENKES